MTKKGLIETNPYLKDPKQRKISICTMVSSSTAIEGTRISVKTLIDKTSRKKNAPVKHTVNRGSGASGGRRR